ncbi:hypothetical protein AB1Y20_008703 [Prymnesium parvum]|uniref:Protein xylosyltransferase n=1 Tax=Prymnesium parvum TaxID=97485 RepID=A0AB34IR87_PRYPA
MGWLGATGVHSEAADARALVGSIGQLCDAYPQLHVIVNFFDAPPRSAEQLRVAVHHPQMEATSVPGMKTLFWRRILTPERVRSFSLVWVFDCDIAVHPSIFPLGILAGTLTSLRATLLQPSIRAQVHGTYHTWLRVRPAHMSCVATTAQWVELQTPVFAVDAWVEFHTKMLSVVKDEDLAVSDFGIDVTWCGLLAAAFPGRPTCLVLPADPAIHINTHSIEKFMSKSVVSQERSCTGTCKTLYNTYQRYWKNFSHHTGDCWGTHQDHHGLTRTGRLSLEGSTVRARPVRSSSTAMLTNETDEAMLRRRWLGATSVAYPEGRNQRAHFDGMLYALSSLMNAHSKLRIIVNHHDARSPPHEVRREPPARRPSTCDRASQAGQIEASVDSRITTTWVVGPRAVFWAQVLLPLVEHEQVDLVWLFSPGVAVHPAFHPLVEMAETLFNTNALAAGFSPEAHPPTRPACIATPSAVLDMSSSIVMRREGFSLLVRGVINKLPRAALEDVDLGLGDVLCSVLSRHLTRHITRVACVRLHSGLVLLDSREAMRNRCRGPCAETLQRRFAADYNATWHAEPQLCWAASSKGLRQLGKKKDPLSPPSFARQSLSKHRPGGRMGRALESSSSHSV